MNGRDGAQGTITVAVFIQTATMLLHVSRLHCSYCIPLGEARGSQPESSISQSRRVAPIC